MTVKVRETKVKKRLCVWYVT